MTPWLDAVYHLRNMGYSLTVHDEKLRYAYRGGGNPQPEEIKPLLGIVKTHRGEILNDPFFLIEATIEDINRGWHPGTLEWVKRSRPVDWKRMVALEAMINGKALTGDIEGLRKALEKYRGLILAMVEAFSSKAEQTTLLNTLKKGGKTDEETYHSQL